MFGALAQGLRGQSARAQTIQASILGAGGETYSVPYLLGGNGALLMGGNGALRQPAAPTFTVLADGKQVDSGNLEYG